MHSSASSNNSLISKLAGLAIAAAVFIAGASGILFLSFRGSEVKVPQLIGKTEAEADQILSSAGLRLKIRNRTTDEKIQANLISLQSPGAGSTVKAGQAVGVTISTGIEAKKPEEASLVKPVVAAKPKPSASPKPEDTKVEASEKPAESAAGEAAKPLATEKTEEAAPKVETVKPPVEKPAGEQPEGEKLAKPAASKPAVRKPSPLPRTETRPAVPTKPVIN